MGFRALLAYTLALLVIGSTLGIGVAAAGVNKHTSLVAGPAPGYITSPSWPVNYPHNHQETWTFRSIDSIYVIVVQAVATHIEQDAACRWDYVQVHDGPSTNSPPLGRFCGYSRPIFTSSGENMTINFITDDTRNYAGFKIKYWCSLRPGVSVKAHDSHTDNIVAVILASLMFVTVSYFVIISACRGSTGRAWWVTWFRPTQDKVSAVYDPSGDVETMELSKDLSHKTETEA
ncbi:CUB and zona pellucida-like domain-containing protein 1 isoform X1 [Haliotis rufescens]|uniref:CUB and zona pellucida-like domain-containing protein 1 isoform X1 n=1 Tax=Haliotis rufescens TaxID=6454 RepID=UPI001EB03295|nr:CUB and zona pellucida-like domain-containing protein 1 isoform X1 [Haliotis rufescens]XP_046363053.1 CUB and zona pellucida-like domain-containing protein 1 isoform X1 [Haliotis rufescens]XP_046363054.1 CUB and zona pellucida-like domain-containing protein 1 isoform X1 [Haliotis rufescens]